MIEQILNLMDEESFNRAIGSKIKSFREAKGLKQKDLASVLDLGRTSVANIEKGTQNINLFGIFHICIKLGVTPLELFPDFDDFKSSEHEEKRSDERKLLDSVFKKHNLRR